MFWKKRDKSEESGCSLLELLQKVSAAYVKTYRNSYRGFSVSVDKSDTTVLENILQFLKVGYTIVDDELCVHFSRVTRTVFVAVYKDEVLNFIPFPSALETGSETVVVVQDAVDKGLVQTTVKADSITESQHTGFRVMKLRFQTNFEGICNWMYFLAAFHPSEKFIWLNFSGQYIHTANELYREFERYAVPVNRISVSPDVVALVFNKDWFYPEVEVGTLPIRAPVGINWVYVDYNPEDGSYKARLEPRETFTESEEMMSLFRAYNNEVADTLSKGQTEVFLDVSNASISAKKRLVNIFKVVDEVIELFPKVGNMADITKVDTIKVSLDTTNSSTVPNIALVSTGDENASITYHRANGFSKILVVMSGEMKDAVNYCKEFYYPIERVSIERCSFDHYIFLVYFD